ncbi:hypothetical protein DICSQDRAFT_159789 [Dichomitus squalens LYAD-421 SS1]|uniref:uncharacterized protein n=1 Tax=Dichomitus squalens (strain LYAD-421) TaxID=732165 RepID=UPI000441188D|nr:uncharacterized protein DICSQDRAFT_159789 [Dichomitus squalens LYAD-421 SS1]EJF64734.1 hypothetical protein DICSQDRAFT_159789 [Dichomitus squalens LYAD-421 SS1]
MPTVPSTCVPVNALDSVVIPEAGLLPPDEVTSGPTPDPETDDVMLVQTDDGMILEASPSQCPPQTIAKPHRIELGSLILHSPSSIVGTPFDSSPRFEYPFPPAGDVIDQLEPLVPSFHILSPSFASFPPPTPSLPPPLPLSFPPSATPAAKPRPQSRCFSPTHLKLNAREPPVPPGLRHKIIRDNTGDSTTMISVMGFDIGGATSLNQPSRGRRRSGSLSGLSDKLRLLTQTPIDPSGVARAKEAARIGAKPPQAHEVDIKWKRHSLAICEIDREHDTDDATGGHPGHDVIADILRGKSRGRTRPTLTHSASSMSLS